MQTVAAWAGPEQRRHRRVAVALKATMLFFRERTTIRLIDLSRGGAMAETEEEPPLRGDEVVVVFPSGVQVVSTVAWVKGSTFGLSFHRALESWQLPRDVDL